MDTITGHRSWKSDKKGGIRYEPDKEIVSLMVRAAVTILQLNAPIMVTVKSAVSSKNDEDGRYRGVYIDRDEVRVVVQFDLEDNIVTSATFRQLSSGGTDNLEAEDEITVGVAQQHKDALEHLELKVKTSAKLWRTFIPPVIWTLTMLPASRVRPSGRTKSSQRLEMP